MGTFIVHSVTVENSDSAETTQAKLIVTQLSDGTLQLALSFAPHVWEVISFTPEQNVSFLRGLANNV